jgi:glycosyltransferase involved in cell wall biosynthesis
MIPTYDAAAIEDALLRAPGIWRNHMPKVSIITPFYNARTWLGRAIESVQAQTLDDWELLLVNDGSTDDSPDIVRSYAAADQRVILIDAPHEGTGAARNRALRQMTGEYCLFLDADDTLAPKALEIMVRDMEENDADHVIGGDHVIMTTDETRTAISSEMNCAAKHGDYVFNMRDLDKPDSSVGFDHIGEYIIDCGGPLFYCIWGRLYKTQIIRDFDLRFMTGFPVMEDVNWTFSYLYFCDKPIVLTKECLYNYYREWDKDDAGCHEYIDQFLCFDAPLQSFQRIAYKFGYSEEYCHIVWERLSVQFLNYSSKVFNDNAHLTEEERKVHVRRMADTYTWRWHCHHLADVSPFWKGELGLLDSGYDEAIYQLLKKKMADEGLPFKGGDNIR